MNSAKPLVSVITPFYNTEEYLAECIESVLQQSYSNWEYVLVDNCSTDNSAEIAERYAERYPGKIRVEHNATFLSQVANYNRALEFTSLKSTYCKMVQADDFLFPECLERMVEVAEQDSSIGVVGSYGLEGRFVCFDGLPYPSPVVTGRTACRLFFLENCYLFGSPTQLMLRSELVLGSKPFYDEAWYPFEDAVVIFEMLKHWSFGFVHQVLTFSRRDNASVMKLLLELDSTEAFELLMLRKFGSSFLDPSEFRLRLRDNEREYAHLLTDGLIGLRNGEFWRFHRKMIKRMGYTAGSRRLWWLCLLGLSDVVLNPKRTLSHFSQGLRRRAELKRLKEETVRGAMTENDRRTTTISGSGREVVKGK